VNAKDLERAKDILRRAAIAEGLEDEFDILTTWTCPVCMSTNGECCRYMDGNEPETNNGECRFCGGEPSCPKR